MMPAKEYRDAIAQLGLSQVAAATFFEVSDRTSRNWIRRGAPVAVQIALMTMIQNKISVDAVDELLERTGVTGKRLLAQEKDRSKFAERDWFLLSPLLARSLKPRHLNSDAKNEIVKEIHNNHELRERIIAECSKEGKPLTRQAVHAWKTLKYGVPVNRVMTVARLMGRDPHEIRPDVWKTPAK